MLMEDQLSWLNVDSVNALKTFISWLFKPNISNWLVQFASNGGTTSNRYMMNNQE